MEKLYYAIKLVPSRPTFAHDMTDDEKVIMQEHIIYWQQYLEQGIVVAIGPVLDPNGAYGFGILAVDSEEQVKALISTDPAIKINAYEYYRMMALVPSK